jgi:alpha-D-ribose 1-methylphosphonate 5-triphosphate synthase subunit PhnH
MQNKREFDPVHDAQGIFRKLMQAMANPGRWEDIGSCAQRMETGARGVTLALGVSLLDGEVSFYTDMGSEMDEEMTFLTGSRPASIQEADFIFTRGEEAVKLLHAAKAGALIDPHNAATMLILCDKAELKKYRLVCPGIRPKAYTYLTDTGYAWLAERQRKGYEYPCGIDLVFYTEDGCIMALPRLAREAV